MLYPKFKSRHLVEYLTVNSRADHDNMYKIAVIRYPASSTIRHVAPLVYSERLNETFVTLQIGQHLKHTSTIDESYTPESDALVAKDAVKPFSEMPGPKGLPVIGNLWSYLKKDGYKFNKMFEAMQDLAATHGPVFKEKIGMISHVVVSDPLEYAKVIRVDGKYPHRVELEPLVHYRNRRGMCLGTVNSQGEEWYRHRMVVAKKTLRPKEIVEYIPDMNDVGNDFITYAKMHMTTGGHVPNLDHEIFKWAFESIGTFLFDERIGCLDLEPSQQSQDFLKNLVGFFKYMQPLMYNVPIYKIYPTATWKKYERHADIVTGIGMKYIHKKIAQMQADGPQVGPTGKTSLLTYFLANKDLSPSEANAHALDIMMGGVETTSNAVLWTLYCLATTPSAQDALYREICKILPFKGQITAEKLTEMQYVKASVKETFRLYPITFATSRIIHEEIELGGYHVPAGTHCQANLYGMGRDPRLFTVPEQYKPDRWLRENHEGPGQSLASLPWGHGPRMCVGRRLAEQEIYIALTKIIQNFEVRYDGPTIYPVLNTVMTPDQPIKLQFVPRK